MTLPPPIELRKEVPSDPPIELRNEVPSGRLMPICEVRVDSSLPLATACASATSALRSAMVVSLACSRSSAAAAVLASAASAAWEI